MQVLKISLTKEPNKLLQFPASEIMESTGDIFDPDYYMVDKDSQVVYRREQFVSGESLPAELIVRDRRFRQNEIEKMCADAGLVVLWARCVRAGGWDEPLPCAHDNAKEILILCRRKSE